MKKLFARFLADRRGGAYIMAAFAVVPMFGMVSLAVDYTNYTRNESVVDTAAQSVALHIAKRIALNPNLKAEDLVEEGKSLLGAMTPARAADEVNVVPGLSIVGAPLALHGYDPVAYFSAGEPVRGSDGLAHVHDGAAYRFSSETNLAAFKADPARYVPQYGGFCAFGVSVGKKFDGDPNLWKIEDGKLYLNLNEEIYATFLEDLDGNIRKAEANWPGIEHVAARDL